VHNNHCHGLLCKRGIYCAKLLLGALHLKYDFLSTLGAERIEVSSLKLSPLDNDFYPFEVY